MSRNNREWTLRGHKFTHQNPVAGQRLTDWDSKFEIDKSAKEQCLPSGSCEKRSERPFTWSQDGIVLGAVPGVFRSLASGSRLEV